MLDTNFHITTPRLYISYLDPSSDAHCDFMFEVVNSAKQGNRSPDRDAGRKMIEAGIERLENGGWGRYLISLKPSPNATSPVQEIVETPFSEHIKTCPPVGLVTMQLARFPGAPTIPDVGFALLPRCSGKGYATEATVGLMKYFEEERGVSGFAGLCKEDNEASKNVLRRLGFEEKGVRDVAGIIGEGRLLTALVWTKGVSGGLEEYGF